MQEAETDMQQQFVLCRYYSNHDQIQYHKLALPIYIYTHKIAKYKQEIYKKTKYVYLNNMFRNKHNINTTKTKLHNNQKDICDYSETKKELIINEY